MRVPSPYSHPGGTSTYRKENGSKLPDGSNGLAQEVTPAELPLGEGWRWLSAQ